jgi:hypothetical protein
MPAQGAYSLCDETRLCVCDAGAQELHNVAVTAALQDHNLLLEVRHLNIGGICRKHFDCREQGGTLSMPNLVSSLHAESAAGCAE